MPMVRHVLCNEVVGRDADDRPICCDKPRCDEAGRRSLCSEYWKELVEKCGRPKGGPK